MGAVLFGEFNLPKRGCKLAKKVFKVKNNKSKKRKVKKKRVKKI